MTETPNTIFPAWQLHGQGFESLRPGSRALRKPGPKEVLLRVDAVGLCLSDIKIIRQGSSHPRLRGRDLATDPTVLGHECAVTVVEAGEAYTGRFSPGDRFVVQADIYYGGEGFAFGYLIAGGLAQYTYADERVIEGDEGCYLLPVNPSLGYSQSALAEPWACVEMSYDLDDRRAPLPDGAGRCCIVDGPGADALRAQFPSAIAAPREAGAEDDAFDDVLLPAPTPELVAHYSARLAKGGVLFLLGNPEESGPASLDIGRNHYEGIRFYGGGDRLEAIAERNARHDLLPGGAALFIGGGGPMGQMHVQRAVEAPEGPATVVVTGLNPGRMEAIERRFGNLAERKGVALHTLSRNMYPSDEAFAEAITALAPEGYSDLCVIAPDAKLVTECLPWAADGALVNVFAGVPSGTMADIGVEHLCRGVKIIGSSGSRIRDMETVLRKIEAGALDTNRSIAAIAGLDAAKEGLEGLADARFPGKTVVYPALLDLPLMGIDEIPQRLPQLAEHLGPDGAWTVEAEAALLAPYLEPIAP